MSHPQLTLLLAAGVLLCSQCAAAGQGSPAVVFREVVQPFLTQHCVRCHGAQQPKGDVALHEISGKLAAGGNTPLWSKILDQLELQAMPPEKQPQPEATQQKAVMDWIAAELGHAGEVRDVQLLERPEYGNYVNHQKLFDGSIREPSYSLPRVWRVSAELVRMGSPFPESKVDYAEMQTIDEPMTMRLLRLSEEISDQLLPYMLGQKQPHRNAHHNAQATRAYGIPKLVDRDMYLGQKVPSRSSIDSDIQTLFQTFVSRAPTAAERSRYADFLSQLLARETDRVACLATVMRALLMPPGAIYRMELGLGQQLADGRRMLSADELAIAVPMSLGRREAVTGLNSREAVETAVRTTIVKDRSTNGPSKTPHGINPRFLAFMQQYFQYDQAVEVFKGDRHAWHAKQHAAQLVAETDQIVVQILRDDREVLKHLLTTDQVIVGKRTEGESLSRTLEYYQPNWKFRLSELAGKKADRKTYLSAYRDMELLSYMAYYGLEPNSELASSTKAKDIIKSPVPRAGILTHPSWLQAHSTFTDNHVVLRGKWIREKLLGGTIPDVPIGVDAAIPDTENLTLRQRLASTQAEFCWRCHQKMDPLGYPLEMYDDFGRYRSDRKERLINGQLHTKPIDTTGAITASGDPNLDGPVSDAVELMNKLAASQHVRQVFVRHVFRFFLGRNETLADSQTLIRADQAYVASGGSFTELVVSLLTSDSFLCRRVSKTLPHQSPSHTHE